MDKQKVTIKVKNLKESVDEIYNEIISDSPRKVYLDERIKHLKPQIEELEEISK